MVDHFHLTSTLLEIPNLDESNTPYYCIIYVGNQILVRKVESTRDQLTPVFIQNGQDPTLKTQLTLVRQASIHHKCLNFGIYCDIPCYLIYFPFYSNPIDDKNLVSVRKVFNPQNYELHGLREFFSMVEGEWIMLAGIANHLMEWDRKHIFCGQCGKKFLFHSKEFAKYCPDCENLQFPRISPAMIIAIVKDNQILLARNSRFPSGQYSVLAGFVTPGESIEETIMREVHEEVRIKVKNIRYFGSQPWPFPDSLMLGFTAEWSEGEIQVDNVEIADARWFTPDTFPKLPMQISISRQLIEWYRHEYEKSKKY